jgi:hypothetical protein
MKKLSLILLFLLITSPCWAFDLNPDRFPSLGINLEGGTSTDGTFKVMSSGASTSQDVSEDFGAIAIDTRIPVSEHWTLNAAIILQSFKTTADETAFLFGSESKISTFAFSFGARYYFH